MTKSFVRLLKTYWYFLTLSRLHSFLLSCTFISITAFLSNYSPVTQTTVVLFLLGGFVFMFEQRGWEGEIMCFVWIIVCALCWGSGVSSILKGHYCSQLGKLDFFIYRPAFLWCSPLSLAGFFSLCLWHAPFQLDHPCASPNASTHNWIVLTMDMYFGDSWVNPSPGEAAANWPPEKKNTWGVFFFLFVPLGHCLHSKGVAPCSLLAQQGMARLRMPVLPLVITCTERNGQIKYVYP